MTGMQLVDIHAYAASTKSQGELAESRYCGRTRPKLSFRYSSAAVRDSWQLHVFICYGSADVGEARSMRVVHLLKTNGAGWAFRLICDLASHGVQNIVVMPSATEGYAPRYESLGIEVIPLNTDVVSVKPWRLPSVCRELRTLVADRQPDIVHSHFVGTTIAARMALSDFARIPRVFQIPGPLHLEHLVPRLVDLWTADARDFYIATSEYTRRLLLQAGVDPRRVFFSYGYGKDIEAFHGRKTGRLRAEFGISSSAPLIGLVALMYPPKLYLGQLTGIKGHECFIDAMEIIRLRYPDAKGIVIGCQRRGGHRYEESLKRRAVRRCPGGIVFAGYRSDVPDIYGDLDVAVHPSLSENGGGAVESLLSGIPTVASRVGGLPEVVLDGETGLTFTAGDPDDLASKVCYLLAHPEHAATMAAKGRLRQQEMSAIGKSGACVRRAYEGILHASLGGEYPQRL